MRSDPRGIGNTLRRYTRDLNVHGLHKKDIKAPTADPKIEDDPEFQVHKCKDDNLMTAISGGKYPVRMPMNQTWTCLDRWFRAFHLKIILIASFHSVHNGPELPRVFKKWDSTLKSITTTITKTMNDSKILKINWD